MSNELIINSTQDGCRIALLKERSLVEFHHEVDANKFTVGDIYLGSVRKVVPGLNAAFIDVGYEKDAFLHYLDLGPQIKTLNKFTKNTFNNKYNTHLLGKIKNEPDINKLGKINQVLNKNQAVLVQIVKEPISTKGPRLSCELSIAGRYLILVPFSSVVNISKKITNKNERKRLMRLISSIKPEGFGIIIRTVAEGKEVAELDRDLRNLVNVWAEGVKKLKKAKPRDKIIGEMSRASSLLRDMLNESFDSIVTDDQEIYEEVKTYIKTIAPAKEKIVKHYNGKTKLFENFGIEKQLKSLFGQSVSIPGGGYLIIEHTEALHVIDVNSGNKSNSEKDQETTALNVNLQAVSEIARQLRLRDMGGIIVIDFIDMRKQENKKAVFDKMKEEMKVDRAKNTVLPLTKFGLMQITRQRVRPELNIITKEICPTCGGTGKVAPTLLVSDQIEKNLEYILVKQNEPQLTIALHPFLHAYFTRGIISRRVKWFFKYKRWVRLEVDSSLGLVDYHFHNKAGEQIELS
ncbi:ribonuclease G [Catalinimonas alkaloidigena]|uniref:Rne/Rng family ribonuclease n=1 Tax=Catalinimonas alkaloidigena TaxID=1075417 RepID=UPI0024049652|nr:Rne/Rng family ribonuclease [Catalinimonas alkaloidigena]MDF9800916.1 ribonuclease G [Catalinimonas alkaloidigena]